jgi:phosphoribosylformylglycinamidine synthase
MQHVLMKVETHNHPTAISPFPGASTGSAARSATKAPPAAARAQGRPGRFHRVPLQFDERHRCTAGRPHCQPAADHDRGAAGRAAFNNEFGRPNLLGYFREYEQSLAPTSTRCQRGYHKPIMIAGGLGSIDAGLTHKIAFPAGSLLVQLGGPGMRIGMGGSAASSMATGANSAALDFDSVQRGNPEMQRRAQEVINHCWALGRTTRSWRSTTWGRAACPTPFRN